LRSGDGGGPPAVPVASGLGGNLPDVEAKTCGHCGAIGRVRPVEVAGLADLDLARHAGYSPHQVAGEPAAPVRTHRAIEVAGLGVVVVDRIVVEAVGVSGDLRRRLAVADIVHRPAEPVGLVFRCAPELPSTRTCPSR
jgi:hypothetical protein